MNGRFLLLRHARTAWNAARRIQGQTDVPLSTDGLRMAGAWAEVLRDRNFDALLSSDLSRAVETARIISGSRQLPHLRDARLREQDWGRWVGLTTSEVTTSPEYEAQEHRGWDFQPPDGEGRREVLARALAALRDAAVARPGRTWLVVSHQGVLKALVYHLSDHDFMPGGTPIYDRQYRLREVLLENGTFRLLGPGEVLPE